MQRLAELAAGCLVVAMVGGCRTATRVVEVPRVDLDLAGGNRGYLVGTPPAPGPMKTTRQMLETDIELPFSFGGGRPSGSESSDSAPAQQVPAADRPQAEIPMESGVQTAGLEEMPSRSDTYTVKTGDSLWSIAAKPEIYGRGTQWRRIYDANRAIIQSPNRLKAGLRLTIPRGEGGAGEPMVSGDAGVVSRK